MYNLERHGYSNVVGLKRRFAIEVDDYSEKETLLDDIFSKSRVPNTELFALDIDLVVHFYHLLMENRSILKQYQKKKFLMKLQKNGQ